MNIRKKVILSMIGIGFITSCLLLNITLDSNAITTTKKSIIASKQKKSSTKKPVVKKAPTKIVKKAPVIAPKKAPIKPTVKVIAKTPSSTNSTSTNSNATGGSNSNSGTTNNNSTQTTTSNEKPSTVEQTFAINSMEELFQFINTKSIGKIEFKNTKVEKTYNKAKEILAKIITDKMTAFEKEKTIHDYIIANVKLNIANNESKSSYEALVDNNADAYGYAEAIKLLLNLSNIECTIINGEYTDADNNKIKHSWNLVILEGKDYHLDAAFDNNINNIENANKNEYMNYDHFNVCDNTMESTHIWEKTKYAKADNSNSDMVAELLNDMITSKAPVQIKGDWLYFANDNTQGKLAKCKFDGTSNTILLEDGASVSNIEISNKWLVYSSDYLYKLKLDTNERVKINQAMVDLVSFNIFSIENDDLYYLESAEEEKFFVYKVNINNVEKTLLFEKPLPIMNFFKVVDNELYYFITEEGNSGLVKVNLKDKVASKIIEGEPVNIEIRNESIYFSFVEVSTIFDEKGAPDQTKTVTTNYRCNLNGAGREQIGEPIIRLKAVPK